MGKKKINSRAKGAQAEREFANLLKDYGFDAKRGQQHAGSPDSPDVIHNIPNVHFEVKRVERLNIEEAMAQAIRDCGDNVPIVAHRRNGKKWLVTMGIDEYIDMVQKCQILDMIS